MITFGLRNLFHFFFKLHRLPATFSCIFGIFMVLKGYAWIGIFIELFGMLNLTKNYYYYLRYIPYIGPITYRMAIYVFYPIQFVSSKLFKSKTKAT